MNDCKHTIGTSVDEEGCCVACGEDLNHLAVHTALINHIATLEKQIKTLLDDQHFKSAQALIQQQAKRIAELEEELYGILFDTGLTQTVCPKEMQCHDMMQARRIVRELRQNQFEIESRLRVRNTDLEAQVEAMKCCVNCDHGRERDGERLISWGCEAPFGTQKHFTGICCDGWKQKARQGGRG